MKKFYLLLSISFFITSCQKEDIAIKIEDQPSSFSTVDHQTATAFLQQKSKSFLNSSDKKILQLDFENLHYEEITNSKELLTVIPATIEGIPGSHRILMLKVRKELRPIVMSLYEDGLKQENFTGTMVISDLDGKFISGFKIKSGLLFSRLEKSKDSNKLSDAVCDEDLAYGDFCSNTLTEVIIEAPATNDTPQTVQIIYIFDGVTDPTGTYWNYSQTITGGGTGSGTSDYRPKIFNQLVNPCAKNIFEKLTLGEKTTYPNINSRFTPFSKEMLDLFNHHKTVNYYISENNIGKNYTQARSGNLYTTLDSNYLSNATTLSIARTMIHESLHAYLLLENSTYGSTLYDSLVIYAKKNGYSDPNDIHHNFMGSYINAMTYSLYVWDLHHGTGGIIDQHGNIDVNYYRSMAFGGFYKFDSNGSRIDYDSFIKLVPNQTERDKILQIIKNEQDGNFFAKGKDC